jgi:cell division ATPase FtsA
MVRLPFKLKSKEKSRNFLTIDIGSNSVKVFAFNVISEEQGSKAEIIGISKQDLLEDASRGGIIVNPEEVSRAVETAIAEVVNGGPSITDVIFGVSGTLSLGLMTTVRVVRGKEGVITEKELDSAYERIFTEAYNQAQNKFLEVTGDSELDFQMITSSTVYAKLDNKLVDELVGEEGQTLEVAVFTAFTPSYHLDLLQSMAKDLKLNIQAISSNMYALTKSLGYSKGKDFDGVIMDVGGELTDVGTVFRGGIVTTRSLDLGGDHFTRTLSKGMDLSLVDAANKKLEYSYGRLHDSDGLLIKGHMDNLLDVWLSGIELLFRDFEGVKTFAPNIYMVGGGAELTDIYEVASKEPWTRSIPFKTPPEFSKLTIEDLSLIIDKTGKAHAMEDVIPASLSIVYLELKDLI